MKLFLPPLPVSIIIPICNELENIPLLYQQLRQVMHDSGRDYELIFVDDGSTDGSTQTLAELSQREASVRVIEFRRNFGQTAAIQAGIAHSRYDYLVTIDGDLQNEPGDIPMLLDKLDEGYDLVHGWRKDRQDPWLSRKLPSFVANCLISTVTRFPVHDLGCTLKAMRRQIATELELYGEMHRFIPILAHYHGARCVEVETRHHPRHFGTTKYGLDRTLRVVLDLLTVKYMISYFGSPMKFFGKLGLLAMGVGVVVFFALVGMKLWGGVNMTGNPFLLLSCVSMFASLQFFSMGVLGEIAARIYYAVGKATSSGKKSFSIRHLHNMDSVDTRSMSRPPFIDSKVNRVA